MKNNTKCIGIDGKAYIQQAAPADKVEVAFEGGLQVVFLQDALKAKEPIEFDEGDGCIEVEPAGEWLANEKEYYEGAGMDVVRAIKEANGKWCFEWDIGVASGWLEGKHFIFAAC